MSKSALIEQLDKSENQPTRDTDDFIEGYCEGWNDVVDIMKNQPTLDEKEMIRKAFERVLEELKKEVMIEDSLSKNSTGEIKKMHTYGRNCLNVAIKKIKERGISE